MEDLNQAAQTIAKFLQAFISSGALRLKFRVKARGGKTSQVDGDEAEASRRTGEGRRDLYVEFSGPDTPLLLTRNGELLNALEHIAAKILRLEPEDHDRVSFDAERFKANRDRELRQAARQAIELVETTGRPYSFPAMSSRERRTLHLILAQAGLATASNGEGPGRFVVVYPRVEGNGAPRREEGKLEHDTAQIRTAFRHR